MGGAEEEVGLEISQSGVNIIWAVGGAEQLKGSSLGSLFQQEQQNENRRGQSRQAAEEGGT